MTSSSPAEIDKSQVYGDETGSRAGVRFVEAVSLVVATSLINLLSLALPLAILMIYDRVIPNQSYETLWVLAFAIACVVAVDLLLRLSRLSLESHLASRLDHVARSNRVYQMLSERYPSSKGMSLNELLGSLSAGVPARQRALLWIKSVADIPFAFAFLVMIWIVAGELVIVPAAVCLVFGIFSFALGMLHSRSSRRLNSNRQHQQDFVDRIYDSLAQIRTIAAEAPVLQKLTSLYERQAFRFRRQKEYSSTIGDLFSFFSQIMIGSVVLVGCLAVLDGDLSHGGLAAFTLLAGRALEPMRSVYELVLGGGQSPERKTRARQGHGIPMEYLGSDQGTRMFKKPPAINAQMVVRNHEGRIIVDADFKADSGEAVGFSAPASLGKTKVVHALTGLYPYQGSVRYDNIVLDAGNAEAVRHNITLIGRLPVLERAPMMDVLSSGKEDRYADVRYLCHLIGLDEQIKKLPDGFGTMIGDNPTRLPDGLLQQVAIVRGLAANNKVIIVDDATLTLDARTELRFAQTLKMLKRTATILVFGDRPSLRAICDRQFVIENQLLMPIPRPEDK